MTLPKKWKCTSCGKEHEFGLWYAAHCTEVMTHTCDCGAKHETKDFVVWNSESEQRAELLYQAEAS